MKVERGWLLLFKDLGLQATDIARRAGLADDIFMREGSVSVGEYFRLWQSVEEEVGDATLLPIKMAEAVTTEAFSPMLFACFCSPNLSVAMRRMATYKRLIAPVKVVVDDRPEGLWIEKAWTELNATVPPVLSATELTVLVQIARMGTRERISPLRLTFAHPVENPDAYERYLGIAPTVGPNPGILFRASDATMPFLTASEGLWETFEPELRRRLAELDGSAPLSERVRSVLLESLPSGESNVHFVAKRLGVSSRSLQRKLRAEETTYKDVVRATREELARHYLTKTKLAYAEISFLIGFEEPSSFFRAFREWTGETPESARLAAV
ncbi:MAG: AraC family transcriptional regulator ligand-binding domain-containing protein [Myxococcota bacterium]